MVRFEAEQFGRYLTGRPISAQFVDRYVAAMERLDFDVSVRDKRRITTALTHPRLIGFLDGGLALRDPRSALRWKLLVMTAILELTPDHADDFLPRRHWPWFVVYAGFVGVRAGVRGAVGAILVTFIR